MKVPEVKGTNYRKKVDVRKVSQQKHKEQGVIDTARGQGIRTKENENSEKRE